MLRLGLTLLRGGGRASIVRLALMAVGVAVSLLTLLAGVSVARAVGAGAERASTQFPRSADTGVQEPGAYFLASMRQDRIGTSAMTRTLVALPEDGATVEPAWVPPGCTEFPSPGMLCVSPRVAAIDASGSVLTEHLDISDASEIISAQGLRGPDDLVVYQGVRSADIAELAQHAVGWGGGPVVAAVGAGTVAGELVLMVGAPAVVFLVVSARLSSATRLRRMRALRLVGLTRRQLASVAALEGRVSGGLGAIVALALFETLRTWFAGSSLAGAPFFADDVEVPLGVQLALVVGMSWGLGRLCRIGTERLHGVHARAVKDRPASLWRASPLAAATVLAAAYLVLRRHVPDLGHATEILLLVGVLAFAGVLLGVGPVAERGAAFVASRTSSLAVRLGARRLEAESSATVRALAGVTAIVLVAGIALGVLEDVRYAAGTGAELQTITVDGATMTAAGRAAAAELPARAHDVVLRSASMLADDEPLSDDLSEALIQIGVVVHHVTCAEIEGLAGGATSSCEPGALYRVANDEWPSHLRPGEQIALGEGQVSIPEALLDVPNLEAGVLGFDTLVRTTTTAPTSGWPPESTFVYQVEAGDDAMLAFQSALAEIAPLADATLNTLDLEKLDTYRAQTALIRFGLGTGFLLSLMAFVVAMVDRSFERARFTTLLQIVGVGRRALVRAHTTELVLPALLVLPPTAVVSWFLSLVYLTVAQGNHGIRWSMLVVGAGLSGLSVAACLVVGLVAPVPRRVDLADLHAT